MSDFWSIWIIVLVVICIIGSFWLLFATRKDSHEGEETTGHSYDGIEEYNNPLPKWWLNLFYITLFFSIGYLILYPGLGSFKGTKEWTQEGQWKQDIEAADTQFGPIFEQYKQTSLPELANNEEAVEIGRRIFLNVCFACHGSDAGGSPGYPNLTDSDWLYGGTPEAIKHSIAEGRSGVMPAFSGSMSEAQIVELTTYVKAFSSPDASVAKSEKGAQLYQTYCVACHGAEGKGNQLLGAPDLTDKVWLYGSSKKVIARTIREGRNGIMPAHKDILPESKIHLVSAYIYSLSNKK